jgi:hypothetical protein
MKSKWTVRKWIFVTFLVMALAALMFAPVIGVQAQAGQPPSGEGTGVVQAPSPAALTELILYISGILLSLAFSYFPGLKTWYEKQSGYKALILLFLSLVVAAAYFGLACTPLALKLGIMIPCSWDGALIVALAFVKVVVGSQATYLLTKK